MRKIVLALASAILVAAALGFAAAAPKACSFGCDAGALACARCDGKGEREVACGRCSASGSIRCVYCRGEGAWECPRCVDGAIPWDTGAKDTCKLCRGTGSGKCTGCAGLKKIGARRAIKHDMPRGYGRTGADEKHESRLDALRRERHIPF